MCAWRECLSILRSAGAYLVPPEAQDILIFIYFATWSLIRCIMLVILILIFVCTLVAKCASQGAFDIGDVCSVAVLEIAKVAYGGML